MMAALLLMAVTPATGLALSEEGAALGSIQALLDAFEVKDGANSASPPPADDGQRVGRCHVRVDTDITRASDCEYVLADDGSFELFPRPPANFYVAVERRGRAFHAYSNGGEELGRVLRKGACWSNHRVDICLWR